MSIRCLLRIHSYRRVCQYASLGMLWQCRRCDRERWT